MEGLKFAHVRLDNTPALRTVQQDRLHIAVISRTLVLRLYCFDFQMDWSQANAPRAV